MNKTQQTIISIAAIVACVLMTVSISLALTTAAARTDASIALAEARIVEAITQEDFTLSVSDMDVEQRMDLVAVLAERSRLDQCQSEARRDYDIYIDDEIITLDNEGGGDE